MSLAPGDIIADKYRVERLLGSGGMGEVVAARHVQLDELVAVKSLHVTLAMQAEHVTRFLREGRAAVKIKSEHVARVIDVGTMANGAPYMAMELLVGNDLSELLRSEGPLPVSEAIEFVLQACEALAEAHALGIVHRDLKPANLFLSARADGSSCVKILDFGISKLAASIEGAALTTTNGMLGSPLYMCPEQLQNPKDVDSRADIWALGVILYELVSGARPFTGESMPQLVLNILTQTPEPLSSLVADCPKGIDEVVLRCLARDPKARYPNVHAFATALAPFAPPEAIVSIERIARVVTADTSPRRSRTTNRNPVSIADALQKKLEDKKQEDAAAVAKKLEESGNEATLASPSQLGAAMFSGSSTTGASSVSTRPEPTPVVAAPAKQRSALPLVLGGALGAVAIGAIALLAMRGSGSTPTPPPESPKAAASMSASPAPSATASVAPTAKATETAATPTAGPTAIVAPVASPSAAVPPTPTVAPTAPTANPTKLKTTPTASAAPSAIATASAAPTAATTAITPPPANCNPPFTIDAEGKKHYKVECL